jgi:hypothetical protein
MKTVGTNTGKADNTKKGAENKVNPFSKLMEDKKRIEKAVEENVPLSSLKDIKFVRPL